EVFFTHLLGYRRSNEQPVESVLGSVKGYYGCVEAQGRGTLHCHMLVWLDGALDPQEIKDRIVDQHDSAFSERLCAYVDDIISSEVPYSGAFDEGPLSSHPCAVRSVRRDPTQSAVEYERKRKADLSLLASACQRHSHSSTCYKYWPGEPHPKECRFGLSETNHIDRTTIDAQTGEIEFKVSDGLVNNFCEHILEAIRCNMDVRFIGSGVSAKAVLYYITDYITKSQLKMHTAYVALQAAVTKLEEEVSERNEMDFEKKAKLMLIKCANALLAKQETSAPQVASSLMEYGDHYTSHSFKSLYWTSFEHFVNKHIEEEVVDAERDETEIEIGDVHDESADDDNESVCSESCDEDGEDGGGYKEVDDESFDVVIVEPVEQGGIRAKGNQVMDYIYRGDLFNN
ncbi:hypothetical protein SCHPADRAFT_806804, partial [Schizopora paradoxa]